MTEVSMYTRSLFMTGKFTPGRPGARAAPAVLLPGQGGIRGVATPRRCPSRRGIAKPRYHGTPAGENCNAGRCTEPTHERKSSQPDIIVFFREVLRNAGAVPESATKLQNGTAALPHGFPAVSPELQARFRVLKIVSEDPQISQRDRLALTEAEYEALKAEIEALRRDNAEAQEEVG